MSKTHIVYIGCARMILGNTLDRDGFLVKVSADTAESAKIVAMAIGEKTWAIQDGWIRPFGISACTVDDFVAMEPWTVNNMHMSPREYNEH